VLQGQESIVVRDNLKIALDLVHDRGEIGESGGIGLAKDTAAAERVRVLGFRKGAALVDLDFNKSVFFVVT
jgi:hypothetical protein